MTATTWRMLSRYLIARVGNQQRQRQQRKKQQADEGRGAAFEKRRRLMYSIQRRDVKREPQSAEKRRSLR